MKRGDIYKSAGRNTSETANQAMQTQNATMPSGSLPANGAPTEGSAAAVIACVVIVFLIMRFLAGKTGDGERYTGIVPSVQNILVITFAGLLGGTLLKFGAAKLPPNNAMRQLFFQGL